jgi:hypothetical protein
MLGSSWEPAQLAASQGGLSSMSEWACDCVTIDGVWIGNWIYWAFTLVTMNNYDCLTELLTPKIILTKADIKSSQSLVRCLAAAFNGERSPSSGFPNCPRPQLPASHSNTSQQLNPSGSLTHQPNQLTRSPTNSHTNSSLTRSCLVLLLVITYRHGSHRKRRSSVSVYVLLSSNGHCIVAYFAVVA